MKIAGWTKLSFIDFPETISTVVFTAGCTLQCPYCHNPGIVRSEFSDINQQLIFDYLGKRREIIAGAVISGGEPTMHEDLPEFILALRGYGVKIKLDTNGLYPEMIEACSPDYLALDIKTVPDRYGLLGCPYDDALTRLSRSISIVNSMGKSAEVRVTVAPGFVDEAGVAGLGAMLAGVSRVFLQPCRFDVPLLDPSFAEKPPVSDEEIFRFQKMLAPAVGECLIRGKH
jgi:pyruvate formate lyase activating enzyme